MKINTSTQILSTQTLTALKPYQIKAAGAENILYLHYKLSIFLMVWLDLAGELESLQRNLKFCLMVRSTLLWG